MRQPAWNGAPPPKRLPPRQEEARNRRRERDARVTELTAPWNLRPPMTFADGILDLVHSEHVGDLGDAFEAVEAIALGLSEPVEPFTKGAPEVKPLAFGMTEEEQRAAAKELRRAEKAKPSGMKL